ncbi:MAG: HIT family protein [Haliscomenobacter sp.]
MAAIFTRIVRGEIPAYKVAETEEFLAFLDVRPQAKGHTLVIPKEEIDYLFDLEPETLSRLMQFAQRVAQGVRQAVPCLRVGVAVIGLEVPHAHVHLIPLQTMQDINFSKSPLSFPPAEMEVLAAAIAERISLD